MRALPPTTLGAGLALILTTAAARAQEAPTSTAGVTAGALPERSSPFAFRPSWFVYVALQTSVLLRADSLCPDESSFCPIGGGGGVFVAYGRRYARDREWLVGYDFSARNARNIFTSATLQQLRVEHRWVLLSSVRTNFEPFVGVSGGVAVYGESFGISTVGLVLGGFGGMSYHLSPFFSLGLLTRFDALRFVPFTTNDGVPRGEGGVATLTASFLVSATFVRF